MGAKQSRVFITGSAVLSGGVDCVADLFSLVRNEAKVTGVISGDEELALGVGLSPGDATILSRHQILALSVAGQAWESAGLSVARNRLRGEGAKESLPRFGCVGEVHSAVWWPWNRISRGGLTRGFLLMP